MSSHPRIYAFILTLVPNSTDADDILQDTSAIMWRKFEDFKSGTDFVSWGIKIAHNKILEYRRKYTTNKIQFNDELYAVIVSETAQKSDQTESKLQILDDCIAKLPEMDRDLILKRYEQNYSVKSLAEYFSKSIYAIYRSVGRIHDILIRCMRRNLQMDQSL